VHEKDGDERPPRRVLREQSRIGHVGVTSEEPWTGTPLLAHDDIEVHHQIADN
jgi:hypothetical protein